jgi:acetylglutamate/LysW-gamma-L-alpha-aminoadipate kinase
MSMDERDKNSNPNAAIVVKLGGTQGLDFTAICEDIVTLSSKRNHLVLVHGGSAEANSLGEELNYPPRFIISPSGFTSRYTDRRTLEIFTMAVNGKLNTRLVEQLQTLGVNSLGLSGVDGRLLVAERKKAVISVDNGRRRVIRDDYSGKIIEINRQLLETLISNGYIPVIAPLAISTEGETLNVDADRVAAAIAAALQANTLVLLTAVSGLMRSFPDEETLIPTLSYTGLEEALKYAEGRMKKKILGAKEALEGGVGKVIIADGRVKMPISQAITGSGTVIK